MNETSRDEFASFMTQYSVDYTIGNVTPTVCGLFGVTPPEECGGTAVPMVVDQAYHLFGGEGRCEKALFFCPDAVGDIQFQKHPEIAARYQAVCEFQLKGSNVMPSVTPVCYASIFSGASPKVHGIQEYCKPVLKIKTFFDVMAEAGKNIAIVSSNGCSIDSIFRQRSVDYFSLRDDASTHAMTLQLLQDNNYDIIISYMGDYDHYSHITGPWSDESIKQLELSASYAEELAAAIDKCWSHYNRAMIVAPDHGNHPTGPTTGAHGQNIPDDILVHHGYRLRAKQL